MDLEELELDGLLDPEEDEGLPELKEGEEKTIIEGDEEVTYIHPKKPIICKDHYFELSSKDNGYECYQCACGNGRIINPKTHQVVDGKISVFRK